MTASRSPATSRPKARLDEFREFVIHRSLYQLKEADPHSWAIPRLAGAAKAALLEVQDDEYGGGRAERMHSALFAKTMRALGLDDRENGYLGLVPGEAIATVNLMSALGLRRSRRGAIVGHLAMFEMTSALPNRRYGNALRRLGLDSEATDFYDEHVEADAVHENIAAYDLAGGLARQEPDLTADIMLRRPRHAPPRGPLRAAPARCLGAGGERPAPAPAQRLGLAALGPKPDRLVGAVAERAVLRFAAPAERDDPAVDLDLVPLLIDHLKGASDQVGAVLVWGDPGAQYHFPLAKPPKAISPTRVMINPITKLQAIISTMPMMTRSPPRPIPVEPFSVLVAMGSDYPADWSANAAWSPAAGAIPGAGA